MSQRVRVYGWLLCLAAIFCSGSAFAAINDSAVRITWGYKGHIGPEFWGRLSQSFLLCGEGKSQSPIDISRNDVEASNTLILHDQAVPLTLMNDGKTSLTIGNVQTIYNDGHTIQINFQGKQAKESLSYNGKTYQLLQFHFHSPSENQLNGESAPLEIHFVYQGTEGAVVVIGVLVKGGNANSTLQTILNHLPHADGKDYVIQGETINPKDLFPLDNDYYSFRGSLTTPPCTEGIQWIVMASTITASPAQIATIRKVIGGSNARAVQSLNNRIIAYSPGRLS